MFTPIFPSLSNFNINANPSQSCFNFQYQLPYNFSQINQIQYPDFKTCIQPKQNINPSILLSQSPININTNNINKDPFFLNNQNSTFASQITNPSQLSFTKCFDYPLFHNVFKQKMNTLFSENVNAFLTEEKDNSLNIKQKLSSIKYYSEQTNQNLTKLNEVYSPKLLESNVFINKLEEILNKINEKLISVNNELLNQFNSLTNFHGYDERFLNEGRNNLMKILGEIQEFSEIFVTGVIEVNNETSNYNKEMDFNCESFKKMMEPEISKINKFVEEMVMLKKEKNESFLEMKDICSEVITVLNNVKERFIYVKNNGLNKENNEDSSINKENNCINSNINENVGSNNGQIIVNNKIINENKDEINNNKNRMATLKFIKQIQKGKKVKKFK